MEPHSDDGAAKTGAHRESSRAAAREEALKRMLESRRAALAARIREGLRAASPASTSRDQTRDAERQPLRALAEDIERELVSMAATTIGKIDAALDLLAQGSYGDCVECGEPIAERRLTVLPFAIRCLDCQTARDHSLVPRGGESPRSTRLPTGPARASSPPARARSPRDGTGSARVARTAI